MSQRKKSLGKLGEQLAKRLLKNKGYKLVKENFRCRLGEIDLILKNKETLIFVEVKTRTSCKFGSPEEAITKNKIKSILKTVNFYIHKNYNKMPVCRVDAVLVNFQNKPFKLKSIRHLQNITG